MPRIVDHDARRRELVEALLRVAAEQGFAAVSVRTVAAAAGCSSGSLRHYFPSRGAMIDGALRVWGERVASRLAGRVEELQRCDDGEVMGRALALLEELLPLDAPRRDEMAVWLALTVPSPDPVLEPWRDGSFLAIRQQCREVVLRLRAGVRTATSDGSAVPDGPAVQDTPLHGDDELRAAGLHAALDGLALHAFSALIDRPEVVRATLERLLAELASREHGTT